MSEEFNKEFMKLNEKDQKSILNLIQLKNMNKQTEYKRRIDKAIEFINNAIRTAEYNKEYEIEDILISSKKMLEILKGENNEI